MHVKILRKCLEAEIRVDDFPEVLDGGRMIARAKCTFSAERCRSPLLSLKDTDQAHSTCPVKGPQHRYCS
jgi:hypothetical protein